MRPKSTSGYSMKEMKEKTSERTTLVNKTSSVKQMESVKDAYK